MEVKATKTIDIFTQPWAISPDGLESIITAQNEFDYNVLAAKAGEWSNEGENIIMRGSTAILPITGPIFRHGSFFSLFFEVTSLSVLAKDFKSAMDSDKVESIILDIDSPGGQVSGVNEFAQMVYEARGEKPITAYVGGSASSAAYWIASAADKIVIDATARLGSIGVVVAMRKPSSSVIEIVSTNSPMKRPDPDSVEGRKEILKTADALADEFIKIVARNRKTDPDTVISDYGRGGVLVGAGVVSAGMADNLGNLELLISQQIENKGENIMADILTKEQLTANFKQVVAEAPDLLEKFKTEARQEGHNEGTKEGTTAERTRVTEILGADADPVETKKAIEEGTAADAAYKQFYTAEREKRALGLKGLETEATKPVGQEELSAEELAKKGDDVVPIDQQLTAKAKTLADEKGISYVDAVKQLAATESQLRSKWVPKGMA